MVEDGEKGVFDLVITKEITCFARNTLDSIQYTRLGITMHERITEVEEVYEKGVFTFTPTFGSPLPEKLDLGDDTE